MARLPVCVLDRLVTLDKSLRRPAAEHPLCIGGISSQRTCILLGPSTLEGYLGIPGSIQ